MALQVSCDLEGCGKTRHADNWAAAGWLEITVHLAADETQFDFCCWEHLRDYPATNTLGGKP